LPIFYQSEAVVFLWSSSASCASITPIESFWRAALQSTIIPPNHQIRKMAALAAPEGFTGLTPLSEADPELYDLIEKEKVSLHEKA
jgi:hypothetical protein